MEMNATALATREAMKDSAIRAAARLWSGAEAQEIRDREYTRGQAELIREMFGYDDGDDGSFEIIEIVNAIVSYVNKGV